jgi:xanthine dehydrogenase small subunit
LIGAPWSEAAVETAAGRLAEDFQPLTDLRASDAYRLATAANLLRRFWWEHGGPAAATRTAAAAHAAVQPAAASAGPAV